MGRKDDDESLWDELMKPASMDYNFDGKIDDFDHYIEMDELDRALGHGKYDPYEDPYYIAQKEEEEAGQRRGGNANEYDDDDDFQSFADHFLNDEIDISDFSDDPEEIVEQFKNGEIDESQFDALVDAGYVSYDDLELYGDDDEYEDEDEYDSDGDDETDFAPCISRNQPVPADYEEEPEHFKQYDGFDEDNPSPKTNASDISPGERTSEKNITFEFSVIDKKEEKRKKQFPATGIWQYFDAHEWKFIHALYTYDKQLKEDCGTKYDRSEEEIASVLGDIYQFDEERAIADWDWLLNTFPAKTLNLTNEYACDDPFSSRLGIGVFFRLFRDQGDNANLTEYIKQDYVFNYLVIDSIWEKDNNYFLAELLCCYADDDDLFKKCYETALNTQKHCFSKKDLAEMWDIFICYSELAYTSQNLNKYIKVEIAKIGDFGKPVLKYMAEMEEDAEQQRRWEEEERLEAEREAAEAEERRLEEEREAAERAERERQMKILEEMSAPLSTKIIGGSYSMRHIWRSISSLNIASALRTERMTPSRGISSAKTAK